MNWTCDRSLGSSVHLFYSKHWNTLCDFQIWHVSMFLRHFHSFSLSVNNFMTLKKSLGGPKSGLYRIDSWCEQTIIWLTCEMVGNQNHIQYWAPLTETKSWHLATVTGRIKPHYKSKQFHHHHLLSLASPHPTENGLLLFTHFSAKNTFKNGNVMRHREQNKYHIWFRIPPLNPSKMFPMDINKC